MDIDVKELFRVLLEGYWKRVALGKDLSQDGRYRDKKGICVVKDMTRRLELEGRFSLTEDRSEFHGFVGTHDLELLFGVLEKSKRRLYLDDEFMGEVFRLGFEEIDGLRGRLSYSDSLNRNLVRQVDELRRLVYAFKEKDKEYLRGQAELIGNVVEVVRREGDRVVAEQIKRSRESVEERVSKGKMGLGSTAEDFDREVVEGINKYLGQEGFKGASEDKEISPEVKEYCKDLGSMSEEKFQEFKERWSVGAKKKGIDGLVVPMSNEQEESVYKVVSETELDASAIVDRWKRELGELPSFQDEAVLFFEQKEALIKYWEEQKAFTKEEKGNRVYLAAFSQEEFKKLRKFLKTL
jgi:hypothetical protein